MTPPDKYTETITVTSKVKNYLYSLVWFLSNSTKDS
jgi:hypothetical protein